MTTMNRFDYLDSERKQVALLYSKEEWSLRFICASEGKPKRGSCVNSE